jgi:hypothetical protein
MVLKDLEMKNDNIDLDKYIEFRESIKSHMEHPEWLGDFTKEELQKMLENNTKIWIYYLNQEAVCSMMLIPATETSLKKFGIDLEYQDVVDYGPMMVNPNFVGNGLQYQMLQEIDKYSIEQGYKYAAGTIHPDNIYSIRNLIKNDFELINYGEFKRGPRNIYIKKLTK